MAESVAGVAGLLSVLICWIAGGRLMLLARRTRRAPELLVGSGLFLLGGWWSPLIAVGRQATMLPDSSRAALVAAGGVCAVAGIACLALFNWRAFRPGDGWAGALAVALGLATALCFAAQAIGPGWSEYARDERGPWLVATWIVFGNYVWANVEAWRQYAMLARRRRLGLADPVVVDRMRLWAIVLLASALASGVAAVCQALAIPMGGTSFGLWLAAVATLFAASCVWLAFLPPARYLAWVRMRAAAAQA